MLYFFSGILLGCFTGGLPLCFRLLLASLKAQSSYSVWREGETAFLFLYSPLPTPFYSYDPGNFLVFFLWGGMLVELEFIDKEGSL